MAELQLTDPTLTQADRLVVGKWLKVQAAIARSHDNPIVISADLASHLANLLLHPRRTALAVPTSSVKLVGEGGSRTSGGESPRTERQHQGQRTSERSEESTSPVPRPRTWLADYLDAYRTAYGEAPSPIAIRRMARAFKQLEVGMPRSELAARFARYCVATELKFYSVERFGETLPQWKAGAEARDAWRHDPTAPRPGESSDAYLTRLTSGGR